MWVADMDFISPPAVLEALTERVQHGVFGYTLAPTELTSVVVERLQNLYAWKVEPEWIVWLPGLVCGLNVVCCAVGRPGDAVLTQTPIYPPFLSAPKNQNRIVQTCAMIQQEGHWQIDFDDMRRSINASTKLYILCNPHNPCGRIFSRDELTQVADICLRRDLALCSDEIHCDLLLDREKKHLPIAALSPEIADRTITLMAPSKTFNIAGLGLSFAVIPNQKLREQIVAAKQGIVPWPNALSYTAALAAYQQGAEWLEELLDYLRINRDIVEQRINAMNGLSCSHVEATYLAWIDVRPLGLENPHHFFEKAGVGLSNGQEFDGEGFLRLNFGCPRSMLVEALDRMEPAINSL
jgi:cysteine-S-conjugate beta-lyase